MAREDWPTFLALDFETTGTVKGYPSLPWQLGAIELRAGRVVMDGARLDTYLRVPESWPFSAHAPGEHRANRAAIAAAPEPMEVWQSLHAQLMTAVPVAHNASTERNVLARLAPMTRYPRWIDTLRLARYVWPGEASYALEALIPRLGLQPRLEALVPNRAPHDAFYDAVACGLLLEHLLTLPGWEHATVEDLAAC